MTAIPRAAAMVAVLAVGLLAAPTALAIPEPLTDAIDAATYDCYRRTYPEIEHRERQLEGLSRGTPPYPLPSQGPNPWNVDPRPPAEAALDDTASVNWFVVDVELATTCYVSHPGPVTPPDLVSLLWPLVDDVACEALGC